MKNWYALFTSFFDEWDILSLIFAYILYSLNKFILWIAALEVPLHRLQETALIDSRLLRSLILPLIYCILLLIVRQVSIIVPWRDRTSSFNPRNMILSPPRNFALTQLPYIFIYSAWKIPDWYFSTQKSSTRCSRFNDIKSQIHNRTGKSDIKKASDSWTVLSFEIQNYCKTSSDHLWSGKLSFRPEPSWKSAPWAWEREKSMVVQVVLFDWWQKER